MEEHEVLWPLNGQISTVHIWFPFFLGQVSPGFLASFPSEAPQRDQRTLSLQKMRIQSVQVCHHTPGELLPPSLPHTYPSFSVAAQCQA